MIWSAASHSSSLDRWLISPVWTMKEGGTGRALIFAIASPSVAAGFGFAACLNPRCVSLICTKVSSPFVVSAADTLPINPTLRGTPPLIAHTTPVPAQAMHFNRPRRFTPGLVVVSLSGCLFMLFLQCQTSVGNVRRAGDRRRCLVIRGGGKNLRSAARFCDLLAADRAQFGP